jgi:hypothetical protein
VRKGREERGGMEQRGSRYTQTDSRAGVQTYIERREEREGGGGRGVDWGERVDRVGRGGGE